nr:LysM peptidoglycan-binding domain-containing protein [Duganella radicis]
MRQYDARDRNWYTAIDYNDAGQAIRTVRTGMTQDIDGAVSGNRTLTTAASYDKLGHVLSTTDAKGYVNRYAYDGQGTLWQEFHADTVSSATPGLATVSYYNDAFGQHLQVVENASDTAFVATQYTFDRLGHQKTRTVGNATALNVSSFDGVSETRSSGAVTETYGYDQLGRRVSDTLGTTAAGIAAGPTLRVRYDLGGNIVSTIDGNGLATHTAYDALNHKVGALLASGERATWQVDAFGRMLAQTDIAGNNSYFAYNAGGQLTHQYSLTWDGVGRQDQAYTYEDGTGRLLRIDQSINHLGDPVQHAVTTYSYDLDGNRVSEKTIAADGHAVQDQVMLYDGFNRLSNIVSRVTNAAYNVHYTYDDNDNRLRERTTFVNDKGDAKTVDVNYGYDSMNRETRVAGTVHTAPANPAAAAGDVAIASHVITYDWRGNRHTDNGDTYNYDAAGRLAGIVNSGGASYRRYDLAGRLVFSSDSGADESRLSQYDTGGRLVLQRVANAANTALRQTIRYTVYDNLNNVLQSQVTLADGKTAQTTNTYNERIGTGHLLDTSTVQTSGSTQIRSSRQTYDVNGNLLRVQQFDDAAQTQASVNGLSTFINDASGHVLERAQGGVVTHSLFANNELIGSSGADGESFSSVYQPVTMSAQSGVYSVQSAGETLFSIAKALWGDERLWYLIADANGGIGNTGLQPGQQLVIPHRINTIFNGARSFTPYSQTDAVSLNWVGTAQAANSAAQGGGAVMGALDGFNWAGAAASALGQNGGYFAGDARQQYVYDLYSMRMRTGNLSNMGSSLQGTYVMEAPPLHDKFFYNPTSDSDQARSDAQAAAAVRAFPQLPGQYLRSAPGTPDYLGRLEANDFQTMTDAFGNALGSSLAENFNNGGRLLAPRPVNYSTSIEPVTFDAPQVDLTQTMAGMAPITTDAGNLAAALKEFEPSFLDRNATALAGQKAAADNAAYFAAVAQENGQRLANNVPNLLSNVPLPPAFYDQANPLGLQTSSVPPVLSQMEIWKQQAQQPIGPQFVPLNDSVDPSYQRTTNRLETVLLGQFPGASLPGAIATWAGQSESQIHAANQVGGSIAGVEMALSGIQPRQPISVGPRSF